MNIFNMRGLNFEPIFFLQIKTLYPKGVPNNKLLEKTNQSLKSGYVGWWRRWSYFLGTRSTTFWAIFSVPDPSPSGGKHPNYHYPFRGGEVQKCNLHRLRGLGIPNYQLMVNYWFGAWWFGFLQSHHERDCYLGVALTGPKPTIKH